MSGKPVTGSHHDFSGTHTPMMDSSCEFVNIGDEDIEDARVHASALASEDRERETNMVPSDNFTAEANRDEELRHLMDILQERVRSGSPTHSVGSTDSDFVRLKDTEELEVSHNSSGAAVSRFNIIVNRDANDLELSDEEDEAPERVQEEVVADADDRVESDIIAPLPAVAAANADDLALVVPPIRHYIHSPNPHLNTLLTSIALVALGFAVGIAIGHGIGSAREAHLQQEIQEGQKLRLRSVQDDLLMCLRKQEDIDQTINKLNEIENILVDAEHWRNEYEELLNLKLQNEEKWQIERSELKKSQNQAETSYEQLVQSKSCAHDSEYLSRQETTLNSVHEKLEASLTDKDALIEKLQARVVELKVNLMSADKMTEAYKRSNDDKSLLILELKEQLVLIEREVFDLKMNSEEHHEDIMEGEQLTGGSAGKNEKGFLVSKESSETLTVDTPFHVDPVTEDTRVPVEIREAVTQASEQMAKENAPVLVKTSEVDPPISIETTGKYSLDDKTAVDSHVSVEKAEANSLNAKSEYKMGHSMETLSETEEDQPNAAADVSSGNCGSMLDGGSAAQSFKAGTSDRERASTMAHHFSNSDLAANQLAASNCRQEIGQLQLKIANLQEQIRMYRADNSTNGSETASNQTESLTVNLCDYITIDVSRDELLHAYQMNARHFTSLKSFLLSELRFSFGNFTLKWANGSDGNSDEKSQQESATAEPTWSLYQTLSKSVIADVLGTMNNSWQTVSDISQHISKSKFIKKTKKLQAKLSNVASMLSHGVNMVTDRLTNVLDKPKSQPASNQQRQVSSKVSDKFQRRLNKIKEELEEMSHYKVENMKRSAKKRMHERFDDFGEDFSELLESEHKSTKVWVDCQTLWWKQQLRKETSDESSFPQKCFDSLLPWQQSDKSDGSWQFERAEHRQYHREEPDDWFWRRSHDYENPPFTEDEP